MKRNTAKGTEIQFDTTPSDNRELIQHAMLARDARGADRPISSREWLMLAVVCLQAADHARTLGDVDAERRYSVLAHKCDRATDANAPVDLDMEENCSTRA